MTSLRQEIEQQIAEHEMAISALHKQKIALRQGCEHDFKYVAWEFLKDCYIDYRGEGMWRFTWRCTKCQKELDDLVPKFRIEDEGYKQPITAKGEL